MNAQISMCDTDDHSSITKQSKLKVNIENSNHSLPEEDLQDVTALQNDIQSIMSDGIERIFTNMEYLDDRYPDTIETIADELGKNIAIRFEDTNDILSEEEQRNLQAFEKDLQTILVAFLTKTDMISNYLDKRYSTIVDRLIQECGNSSVNISIEFE